MGCPMPSRCSRDPSRSETVTRRSTQRWVAQPQSLSLRSVPTADARARREGMTRSQTEPHFIPIFDGHNDALTARNHRTLAVGGGDGHLDLPRMLAGGVCGGIFAVFTESDEPHAGLELQSGGVYARPLASPVEHERAAAASTSAAGRLFALERDGT